jgi:predicted nucleic-acid-binding protein
VTAFVDTNVLVRHLTGDPPAMAKRATAFLREGSELLLTDLIVAETIYVLESFYEVAREQIATTIRSLLAFDSISVVDREVLLRAVEVYEIDRLDFAEAYLIACAESTGIGRVVSFDRSIDRGQFPANVANPDRKDSQCRVTHRTRHRCRRSVGSSS